MGKISVKNLDGRTREERETCFPLEREKEERKGAGLR